MEGGWSDTLPEHKRQTAWGAQSQVAAGTQSGRLQ